MIRVAGVAGVAGLLGARVGKADRRGGALQEAFIRD
jgi:hypothetical protein